MFNWTRFSLYGVTNIWLIAHLLSVQLDKICINWDIARTSGRHSGGWAARGWCLRGLGMCECERQLYREISAEYKHNQWVWTAPLPRDLGRIQTQSVSVNGSSTERSRQNTNTISECEWQLYREISAEYKHNQWVWTAALPRDLCRIQTQSVSVNGSSTERSLQNTNTISGCEWQLYREISTEYKHNQWVWTAALPRDLDRIQTQSVSVNGSSTERSRQNTTDKKRNLINTSNQSPESLHINFTNIYIFYYGL